MHEGLSIVVAVTSGCAASPNDPDNAIEMNLPVPGSASAQLQLSVMTDGTIGVTGAVEGYVRDSNGSWIAD